MNLTIKKASQSKTNRLCGNRCVGYIMNKFEQVLRDGAKARGCPKVNKFEQVLIGHTGIRSCEQTDRFTGTDMNEHITFLHSVADGNNDGASTGSHFRNLANNCF